MALHTCTVCARAIKDLENEDIFIAPCCQRPICALCLEKNGQRRQHCPMCQLPLHVEMSSSSKTEPPPYSEFSENQEHSILPEYQAHEIRASLDDVETKRPVGVWHYVRRDDTLVSLSLAYGVPKWRIQEANRLMSENIIFARQKILIPGYRGTSLSSEPDPGDSHKRALKRFQIVTKCNDYQMAKLYMEQSAYDLEEAAKLYRDDSIWEEARSKKMR